MTQPHPHPLRAEGYCKRNYRDVGRHVLDLHDGRGIHAWRCLSYRTGHGGRCTFVDCNFTEVRMHYLKHHADELDAVQVKWKKGYYTTEDGHIVPNTLFYPTAHPLSAIDDQARRSEIEEERYQQIEGAAAAHSPMVQMNSAGGMYRQEARRWENEAPPRKGSRTLSPPCSRRNSREERRSGADGEGSHCSYGSGDYRYHGPERRRLPSRRPPQ